MSDQKDEVVETQEDEVEEGLRRSFAKRICYHTRLPCTKDGNCSSCVLDKSIRSDVLSNRELLKASNAIRLPSVRPYVKFQDPSGRPAIEIGIKGTF